MAILTCLIPAFPVALLARSDPALVEQSLAVVGPNDHVLAATPVALEGGVVLGQSARQARLACPDLLLRDVDLAACQAEFDALLALLDDFAVRVEPSGLGRAFLDVPDLDGPNALPFCQSLGRQVRQDFGAALQPALGCDQGKFTAHAAATYTRPGSVRVVLGPAEPPFLRPLPVGLLPLPDESQLQLRYLGLHCLGQYADLPPRAVLQQFGIAGRLAHQWARGRDDRPVMPRQQRPSLTVSAEFDPPLDAAPPLLLNALRLLERPLAQLKDRLQTVQALSATREFTTGQVETDRWTPATPTSDRARLGRLLADRWQARAWDGAVVRLSLTLSEIQDEVGQQLGLFTETASTSGLMPLVRPLQVRYGSMRLLRASVPSSRAPRVERRVVWHEAAS